MRKEQWATMSHREACMLYKQNDKKRTVCEMAREIFDETMRLEDADLLPATELEQLRKIALDIIKAGKRINMKLYKYSRMNDPEWWDAHPKYEKRLLRQLKRRAKTTGKE